MINKKSVILFLLFFSFILNAPSVFSAESKTGSAEVSVSIGDYEFMLFGYSSPSSLITIEGVGILDQTYSDKKGYFEFRNRFSPFSTREPCLSAKDQLGRISHTVCIPPFPRDRNVTIGPVILPPTVHLNRAWYFTGDQIVLSGQTIPNTDVNLSFFIDEKRNALSFVKSAYALSLPKLTAQSDDKGNYSIQLPSSQADYYRVFVQDKFQKQDSPKSTTLSVDVLPWWMMLINFFIFLWDTLKSRFLELLIAIQILVLIYYVLRVYLKPHIIARNRALALRKDYSLLVTEHSLANKDQ